MQGAKYKHIDKPVSASVPQKRALLHTC